jgi:hypothetical protein
MRITDKNSISKITGRRLPVLDTIVRVLPLLGIVRTVAISGTGSDHSGLGIVWGMNNLQVCPGSSSRMTCA